MFGFVLGLLGCLPGSTLVLAAGSKPALHYNGPGTDPGIVWGYLQNGTGYAVIENHAAPMVGSVALVQGGSGNEDWSTQGASHFLEHLLFNGTERRSQEQIYDEIDFLGAYNNATTRATHVIYMLLAPRDDFWQALDVQQDMLFHSTLPAEKVEKERGIILEELAQSRDDQSYEVNRTLELDLFGPYGYGMPTVGSATSIRSLTRDQILAFYRKFYRPNRVTWLILGDVDPKVAVDSLEKRLGVETAGESVAASSPPPYCPPPLLRRHQVVGSDGVLQWSWILADPGSRDYNRVACRLEIMCEGEDSPLGQRVLSRWRGKVASYEFYLREFPGFGVASIRLDLGEGADPEAILDGFPAELDEARASPMDPARVEAWRVQAESQEQYLREKPHYYGVMRGDLIAARGLAGLLGYLPSVLAVSAQEVAAQPAPLTWPPHRISALLPSPSVSGEESRGSRVAGRYDAWDLPNGAHVAALSSPESPVFAVHLFIRDRSKREPAGRSGMAELFQNLLGRSTQNLRTGELSLALAGIGAELKTADSPEIPYDDFYTVPEFSFVRFQTLDKYAKRGVSLLANLLGKPAFSEADFAQAKSAALRRVGRAEGSSRATATRRLQAFLHPEGAGADIYGTSASLSPLTFENLHEFAVRYLDPRSYLFVVATSLPLEDLHTLMDGTLGALPVPAGPSPTGPLPALGSNPVALGQGSEELRNRIRALLRDGSQADLWAGSFPGGAPASVDSLALVADSVGSKQSHLILARVLDVPDSMRAAFTLANAILSDRLSFQLREREGLAYSIGSSLKEESPGAYVWVASAGTGSANLGRMLEGFREAPTQMIQNPPDSAEVRKTAAQIYGRGLMRRSTRINWAYYAGLALLRGEDPREIEARQRSLETISPTRVLAAVRSGWRPEPGLVVLAR